MKDPAQPGSLYLKLQHINVYIFDFYWLSQTLNSTYHGGMPLEGEWNFLVGTPFICEVFGITVGLEMEFVFNVSEKGLMLKTSALETLYGGLFKLSTWLIQPNNLVLPPIYPVPQFHQKLTPLNFIIV